MKYGILRNSKFYNFFNKQINSRSLCKKCWSLRLKFRDKDQKYNSSYSNLLPGFSSPTVKKPIDVLVIALAHGGGRKSLFREQLSLKKEVTEIGNYYLIDPISKFHQYEMRHLFNWLNKNRKTWVFADLIRCFVWQGRDKGIGLDGSDNIIKAIGHCRKYLDKEINFLKPKKILCLGKRIAEDYFGIEEQLKHGEIYNRNIIWSYFPSRNNSDIWVTVGQWKSTLSKI
jgi:hypothetical protein